MGCAKSRSRCVGETRALAGVRERYGARARCGARRGVARWMCAGRAVGAGVGWRRAARATGLGRDARGEGETRRSSAVWSMRGVCFLCVYMCACVLDVVTDVGVVCVFCARVS